jgi:murein hydrolase activator
MLNERRQMISHHRLYIKAGSALSAFLVLVLLIGAVPLSAQRARKPSRKKIALLESQKLANEREAIETRVATLQKNARELESRITGMSEKEQSSLQGLETIESQLKMYKTILDNLERGQQKITLEIERTKTDLAAAEKELGEMKSGLARYAVGIYKLGVQRNEELLFSANSFNQAIVRAKYIKEIERAGTLKVLDITEKKNQILALRESLAKRYADNERLIADKAAQKTLYEKKKADRETLITKLRRDKKKLQTDLAAGQDKTKQLEQQIQKMMALEADALRKEREAKAAAKDEPESKKKTSDEHPEETNSEKTNSEKTNSEKNNAPKNASEKTPVVYDVSGNFEDNRGRLPWPTEQGVIVKSFGENRNQDLNLVTINNGVDIAVPSNTDVYTVADGIVSQIGFLPSFGNIVIIRHSKSYITVYANLSEVKVAKGDKVSAKQLIGASGKARSGGNMVHFEVWRGKEKVNPEIWLAKK